jgi:hypothetical protein
MRRTAMFLALLLLASLSLGGTALAGPSGSTQCHIQDDDCDGRIDEDTGGAADDTDGDGLVDEDPTGDANGDGLADDDGDGRIDEDGADDDGDGTANEDAVGDAADDAGENQTNCNEGSSTNVAGIGYVYAGSNGAEACADEGSALPIDGSASVNAEDGYVAIDGDNGNPGASNGYARLDGSGVHCGDENNQDSSSADQSQNTATDCG